MSETYKISDEEIATNGMASVETRPNAIGIGPSGHISATDLKIKMDALPKLISAKYNKLVDALGIEEEEPGKTTLAGQVKEAVTLSGNSARDAEKAASDAQAAKVEAQTAKGDAEKAASNAQAAKGEAEVSKNRAVLAEQSAVLLKTQVDNALPVLDKRLNNIESYFSPDPFLELSAADGKIDIPANALPWASIDEVGGMTYRKPKTLGSFEPDASLKYYLQPGVVPPARFTIPLRNTTGSEMVVQANFNASVYRQEITLPADGTFHEYTVSIPEGVEYLDAVTSLEILDKDHVVPAGIEAGTLTVYPAEDEYILEHSPVSEVQSLDADGAVLSSVAIPQAVRDLPGYGWGIYKPDMNLNKKNYIDWENKVYHQQIVKLVLTGNEQWSPGTTSGVPEGGIVYVSNAGTGLISDVGNPACHCTHFNNVGWVYEIGNIFIGSGFGLIRVTVSETEYPTPATFIAFLRSEYQKGTPVTIFAPAKVKEVTDLSNILPDDNLIEVTPGGSLRFVTGTGNAPTAKATIMKKEGT